MTTWRRVVGSNAPAAALLIRLAVGFVFLAEGIQKFVYPDALGAGRFAGIGIPAPDLMGPFVGVVEIVCGTAILLGLFTRLAAIPLVIDMVAAHPAPRGEARRVGAVVARGACRARPQAEPGHALSGARAHGGERLAPAPSRAPRREPGSGRWPRSS